MRIEIIQGHDGGRSYYQIERNELIIGSSNQCDVVLPLPDISRRHLSLIVRGNQFFVIDHNSTNGTFIGEEQIGPGQRTEWKTYIPMRLATGVILTLVEDADTEEEIYNTPVLERVKNDQTRTVVIPLAQLKAQAKKKPMRPPPKEKKKSMTMTYVIVAAVIGVAYYLNVSRGMKFEAPRLIRGARKEAKD